MSKDVLEKLTAEELINLDVNVLISEKNRLLSQIAPKIQKEVDRLFTNEFKRPKVVHYQNDELIIYMTNGEVSLLDILKIDDIFKDYSYFTIDPVSDFDSHTDSNYTYIKLLIGKPKLKD